MTTLTEAEEFRAAAKTAYLAAMNVASYSIKDRSKTNQDIDRLKDQLDFWTREVARLTASATGRGRTRYGVTE